MFLCRILHVSVFVGLKMYFYFKPLRLNPGRREKIKFNFCFYTSLWCLKRFYEGLKGLHETFWGTTKKCENKNLSWFLFQYKLSEMHGTLGVKSEKLHSAITSAKILFFQLNWSIFKELMLHHHKMHLTHVIFRIFSVMILTPIVRQRILNGYDMT